MKRVEIVFDVYQSEQQTPEAVGYFVLARCADGLPSGRAMARALRDIAERYDRVADKEAAAAPPAPTFEPGDQVVFTGNRARLVELGANEHAVSVLHLIGTVTRALSRPLGSIGVEFSGVSRLAFEPSDLALVRKGRP